MATCARDGVRRATPTSTPSRSTQAGARHRKRVEPVAFFPSSTLPSATAMLSSSPSSPVSPSSAITAASASFPSHRLRLCLPPLRPSPSTSSVSITITSLRSLFHRSQHRSPSPFAAVAVLFSSHCLASVATPSPVSSSSLRLHRLPLPLHLLRLRRAPPALSHRQLPCLSLFISSFVSALSFRFGHQDRAPPSPPSPPPLPPPSSSPLCCRTPPPLPCFSTPATITLLSGSSIVYKLPPLPCSSAPTTIYRCLHLSSLSVAVIPTPSPSSPTDSTSSPSSASIAKHRHEPPLPASPPSPFPPASTTPLSATIAFFFLLSHGKLSLIDSAGWEMD